MPWVATVIGAVILVAGGAFLLSQVSFAVRAETTTARVTGYTSYVDHSRSRKCNGPTYKPKVTFTTRDGRQIVTILNYSLTCTMPQVNTTVQIRYDPADPGKVESTDERSAWIGPSVILLIGAILFGGGVTTLRRRSLTARHQPGH